MRFFEVPIGEMHTTARSIMVMGLPGSGKIYFAKALAAHIGAAHFNSDRIRKEAAKQVRYTDTDKARIHAGLFAHVTAMGPGRSRLYLREFQLAGIDVVLHGRIFHAGHGQYAFTAEA